jgi:hypothetical protein
LCRLTNRFSETLKITRLAAVFDCYPSEAEAIAAFYRTPIGANGPSPFVAPNVLCVGRSAEALRVYAGSAASGRIERDRDKQPA